MKKYVFGNIAIYVHDNGRLTSLPAELELGHLPASSRAPFRLKLDGWHELNLGNDFVLASLVEHENGLTLTYVCKSCELSVCVKLTHVQGTDVIIQENTVTSTLSTPIKITHFSSAFIENIAYDPALTWYENDDIAIHICHNKWQGEAQWQAFKPYELGLYPASTHPWERASYRIGTSGSWSTANFYPLTVVEDRAHGHSWFMETEGSHNWNIKFTGHGGYTEPSLSIEAESASEKNGAWYCDLASGESYTAERAFWGITKGGFDAATAQMLRFKRLDSSASFNGEAPVIFNVYMDCIWGKPTPENLIPLIDKAAEVGSEYFVIDGGWCKVASGAHGLGDWLPEDFYNETTLSDIIKMINDKGMKAGIWTELDAVSNTAYGYTLGKDAVLRRYDSVLGGSRAFYNMKNEAVRKYLSSRIDELYALGFRYIKNDYNQSTGIGSDNNANGSPEEGNRQNADAFCSFIDEIRAKYPDLVIENCGSGALRNDNKMLRRFEVQSVSDQELYLNNVSIVSGSMKLMPPEKCGIWAYPYPAHFEVYDGFKPDDEYIKSMADGRETVCNMVTAMFGTIFLSGRIDLCDEYNLKLVREGVEEYKKIRKYIPSALPIYPLGTCRINQRCNHSFGLISNDKLLLGVWNIKCDETRLEVDLSEYVKSGKVVSEYFAKDTLTYSFENNRFSVEFGSPNTAAFFELDITPVEQ